MTREPLTSPDARDILRSARRKPRLAGAGLLPLVGAIVIALFCAWSGPARADGDPFAKLFGTIQFKRPMNVFAQWGKVCERHAADNVLAKGAVMLRGGKNVDTMLAEAGKLTGMARIRYVNSFWNQYSYTEDIKNWGKEDYWAIPAEFVKKSGDCEDYAICKYYTFRQLGDSADAMRIVVLQDTVRRVAHAVLAVVVNSEVYILDNVSGAVLPHTRLTQYQPAYSVNEHNAWVHLKGRKLNDAGSKK